MCDLLLNRRAKDVISTGWSPSGDPLAFHGRLPGYRPTRLYRLARLASVLSVGKVFIKDESHRFGLPAFKVLGASWAVYRKMLQALGEEPDWVELDDLHAVLADLRLRRLVTATDGNHGRGVARTAAWLGLEAHVFVPAGTVEARIRGIESEGAKVHIVKGSYDEAVRRAARAAGGKHTWLIQDTSWDGYEDIPRWVIEGYSTLFREIDEELEAMDEAQPDLVLVQVGVGSLAAAAVMHYRGQGRLKPPRIVSVEPRDADCAICSARRGESVSAPGPHRSIMAGLNCGTLASIAWPILDQGMDAFMAIGDDYSRRAMRMMSDHGLTTGESGAAGLGGLLALLSSPVDAGMRSAGLRALSIGPSTRVLLISTEGATDPDSYESIVGRPPAVTAG